MRVFYPPSASKYCPVSVEYRYVHSLHGQYFSLPENKSHARRSRSRRDKGFRISAESKRCSGEADSDERAALRKGNLRMLRTLIGGVCCLLGLFLLVRELEQYFLN